MKTMNLCSKCVKDLSGSMVLQVWRMLPVRQHCDVCAKKGFLTVCEVKG